MPAPIMAAANTASSFTPSRGAGGEDVEAMIGHGPIAERL